MPNLPHESVSPLPHASSKNISYFSKIQMPTELALPDFNA